MLARSTYDQDYIDAQQAEAAAQLAALRGAKISDAAVRTAALENLVLRLELAFAQRLRAAEGRDGNPMNEVRTVADSILRHGRVLTPERTIRLDPATSVLGIAPGGRIALDVAKVELLVDAFFAAIAATYSPASLLPPEQEEESLPDVDETDAAADDAAADAAEADDLLEVQDADVETPVGEDEDDDAPADDEAGARPASA